MQTLIHPFVFDFEKKFDGLKMRRDLGAKWYFCLYVGLIYFIAIKMGERFMKNSPAMNLRFILAAWNVILAVFSLMGSFRMVPELLHVLRHYGLHHSFCHNDYADDNVMVFWGFLFTVSKMVELADTGFIVARKQPLKFIHWFHHEMTMFMTWSHFAEAPAIARWLMTLNYSIHTVMYTYYFLKVAKFFRVPELVAKVITTCQIVQMFIGLAGVVYIGFTVAIGSHCDVSLQAFLILLFGYGSFLYLFVHFFIQRYLISQKGKSLNKTR